MPPPQYSDDAAAVFAVALLGPYLIGAVIYLAYRSYQHFYVKPKYPKVRHFVWCDVADLFGPIVRAALAM